MSMCFATERLSIGPLTLADSAFIQTLVNTPGWLQFIGDRHIHSEQDAIAYIEKINANTAIQYWVVRLLDEQTPIGIVTFIKRDYLPHHDIGFAFLPEYNGKGYAYEATKAVLMHTVKPASHSHVLATTIPGNTSSIRLLTKIGLSFDKEIQVGNDTLHVYGAAIEEMVL